MYEHPLIIKCIDCERDWEVDYEPSACMCDDPADDAYLLFQGGVFLGQSNAS